MEWDGNAEYVKPTEIVRKAQAGVFAVGFSPDTSKYKLEDLLSLPVPRSLGTTFAIADDEFLTCSHVLEAARGIQGTLRLIGTHSYRAGSMVYEVSEQEQDEELDLALLRAKPVKGVAAPLELELERPELGDPVLALGYPLPQESRKVVEPPDSGIRVGWVRIGITFRVTSGIVSSWTDNGRRFEIDAQFSPGISGGPVVSAESGKVVGIAEGFLRFDSFQPVISRCLVIDTARTRLADWRR